MSVNYVRYWILLFLYLIKSIDGLLYQYLCNFYNTLYIFDVLNGFFIVLADKICTLACIFCFFRIKSINTQVTIIDFVKASLKIFKQFIWPFFSLNPVKIFFGSGKELIFFLIQNQLIPNNNRFCQNWAEKEINSM